MCYLYGNILGYHPLIDMCVRSVVSVQAALDPQGILDLKSVNEMCIGPAGKGPPNRLKDSHWNGHQICYSSEDVTSHANRTDFMFTLNTLRAKFFRGNKSIYLHFFVNPLHWYDAGKWKPSSWKTKTCLFRIANIMAADALAMQAVRASTAMVLTQLYQDNSVPAR